MNQRMSVTQEEILRTLRRIGEPMKMQDVVSDVRERKKQGDAHQSTQTSIDEILREWSGLEEVGRVRRVAKGATLWEIVPRVEIVEDGEGGVT